MHRILNIVLAAWAGSLWTICGIVAPALFAQIPERHLAGQVAGHFFAVEAWLGLALGAIALILLARHAVAWVKRFDYGLMIVTMLAPVISEIALRPLMAAARAEGDMGRFGLLHAASGLLFLLACSGALVLVWRLSAPSRAIIHVDRAI